MKKLFSVLLVLSLLLSGCGILEDTAPTDGTASGNPTVGGTATNPTVGGTTGGEDISKTDEEMFTDRDSETDYNESKSVQIQFNGDSVTCNSTAVRVEGTVVTIGAEGTFVLRGKLNNGRVVIRAKAQDKVQLVLDGADITCANSAALYVEECDKVFVTLEEGSENRLVNGGSLSAEVDGAVFSRQDLAFNGAGSLTVESPAGKGIVCKDDLVFTGGTYTVNAASHALDANDSIRVKDALITVDAGMDGLHVEDNDNAETGFVYISGGKLNIESEGDGISAALSLEVSGGDVKILSGGGYKNGNSHSSGGWGDFMGSPAGGKPTRPRATTTDTETSMKGLKAGNGLLIEGGTLTVDSADDALHSNAAVIVSGGTLAIASGDDGIHADTDLTVSGGEVKISTSYEGLEALNIFLTGGKISLVAADDGLNAAGGNDSSGSGGRDQMFGKPGGMGGNSKGSIIIKDCDLRIQASGDGIDANGTFEVDSSYVEVCCPNSGDTAILDYDVSGSINTGVFVGTGSSFMFQSFSEHAQGLLFIKLNQSYAAGTTITVTDATGEVLLNHQPNLDFSAFMFSVGALIPGRTYQVTVGTTVYEVKAT